MAWLFALAAACGERGPTEPGRGEYRILFVLTQTSDTVQQLAVVDPEGGPVELFHPDFGIFEDLKSSPDGNQVLFTRYELGPPPHGVHAVRADRSGLRAVPNVGRGYVWSPDGSKIASLSAVPGSGNPPPPPTSFLRITDAAGTVLTDFPRRNADYPRPSWSPDGTRLVYTEDVRFDDRLPEVFVANADGTNVTNISNDPEYEWEVAWSPATDVVALFAVRGSEYGIFTCRPDGSDLVLRHSGAEVLGYDWSPDGTRLLFTAPGATEQQRRIVVMGADGSAPAVVAEGVVEGNYPAWSPDGQWITYAAIGSSGEYDVYVVRPDGSGLRNLTEAGDHGRSPVWIRRD